jgi:thiamine biosynthesis lipoprotein
MSGTKLDRRTFLALGAGALGVATAPAWLRPGERLVRLTVPVMGTVGELAVPARHERLARQALGAAAAELRRIEGLMTRFSPDSDVGRFNAAAPGTTVSVSPETAEVVREALDWARAGDGAFDPTLERLSVLWDPTTAVVPPDAVRLRAAEAGGWRSLAVDGSPGAARILRTPGAALDLGGIAKGYGVDRAATVLREHGIHRGLVNVGGDLMALGDGPGGDPWRIGVRDPAHPSGIVTTLEMVDAAVATSGDYLRYLEHDGRRYAHILDVRTREPARGGLHSITVSGKRVVDADAAATLTFVLGPEEGRRVLEGRMAPLRIEHHIPSTLNGRPT